MKKELQLRKSEGGEFLTFSGETRGLSSQGRARHDLGREKGKGEES